MSSPLGSSTARSSSVGFEWRIVHRFMDKSELTSIMSAKKATQGSYTKTMEAAQGLVDGMSRIASDAEFGEIMHKHTMTQFGGGKIGGSQLLVSMTSDAGALSKSTDPAVQRIVRNAPFMASFQVPKMAAIGAASDLSHSESEVVLPNDLNALSAMLFDFADNPYKESAARRLSASTSFPDI